MAKKNCPNCDLMIGVRTILCSCGYHYPSKEVRQDLLEEKNNPKPKIPIFYIEMGPCRKQCPSCNSIVMSREKVCLKCNFDFVSAKKEKDKKKSRLREEKRLLRELEKKEKELEKEKLREEKRRNKEYEQSQTVSAKTKKILSELTPMYDFEPIKKLTSEEHAERILSYGEKAASHLLHGSKKHNCWTHVDWKIVERKLEK